MCYVGPRSHDGIQNTTQHNRYTNNAIPIPEHSKRHDNVTYVLHTVVCVRACMHASAIL